MALALASIDKVGEGLILLALLDKATLDIAAKPLSLNIIFTASGGLHRKDYNLLG
jgi:hypothetical protein